MWKHTEVGIFVKKGREAICAFNLVGMGDSQITMIHFVYVLYLFTILYFKKKLENPSTQKAVLAVGFLL